jgi:Flp pilus assembly pilin Flp
MSTLRRLLAADRDAPYSLIAALVALVLLAVLSTVGGERRGSNDQPSEDVGKANVTDHGS